MPASKYVLTVSLGSPSTVMSRWIDGYSFEKVATSGASSVSAAIGCTVRRSVPAGLSLNAFTASMALSSSINQGSQVLSQMLTSFCQADASGGSVQKPHAEFVF